MKNMEVQHKPWSTRIGRANGSDKKTPFTKEQAAEVVYYLWRQSGLLMEQKEECWRQAETELKQE